MEPLRVTINSNVFRRFVPSNAGVPPVSVNRSRKKLAMASGLYGFPPFPPFLGEHRRTVINV